MKIFSFLAIVILLGAGCNSIQPVVINNEIVQPTSSVMVTNEIEGDVGGGIEVPSDIQAQIPPHFLPKKQIMVDLNNDSVDEYVFNIENLVSKAADGFDLNYFIIIDGKSKKLSYFSENFSGRSIKMVPLKSSDGRTGLFVGYENGGAGVYFTWAVVVYQNGKFELLSVDNDEILAKIDREDLGYDDAEVVGDNKILETYPGYSKSKPTGRCCPSAPNVHIEYIFTGNSLKLLRVYSEKNKPLSFGYTCPLVRVFL